MNLKKIFLYGATTLLLVSCANEDSREASGYGSINVRISADYEVIPATRSTGESTSTPENPDVSLFALKLVSSDGSFTRAWNSLADFDPATKIPIGSYTMSAFYGDLDNEGFDQPYYLGESDVAVRDRENSPVEIHCTLANVKVTVEYSEAFKKYFADYATTIHSEGGSDIKFNRNETRAAYVKPGKITIQTYLKKQNGIESTFEPAAIENATARQHYRIKLDIADNNAGEAQLNISFDEATETVPIAIDISDEVMVAPAPSFLISGFESGTPLEVKEYSSPSEKEVNISISAKAGISSCTLTTSSSSLESQGWPQEIDLVNMSSGNTALLNRLGLKTKGLSEMGGKLGFIDFSQIFSYLYINNGNDLHTFTVSVKDIYGKVSESPITLSVKSLPITLTLSTPEAIFVGSSSATIPVEFDGTAIDQVKFSYIDGESGQKTNCTSTVLSSEGNLHQVKISLRATNKPVEIEASFGNGSKTVSTVIPVKTPEFSITAETYDIWAKKAIVKLTATDSQYQDAINRYAILYTSNAGQWVQATSTSKNGLFTITGLTPDTEYQLRGSCNSAQENVNYSGDCTLRTEVASAVPNGDFEELTQTINISSIQQGGQWTSGLQWLKYTYTSYNIYEPNGWASVNAKTCNYDGAQNKNTWFVFPSTINSNDIISGSNAMTIRNVGWDLNGTTPSLSTNGTNTPYSTKSPSTIANTSAGKLFLGSYSYNTSASSETYTEGINFTSRPSALKGWYKYTNDSNDPSETGTVTVTLLNGESVIGTGTANLSAAASYTEFTVPVTYSVTNQKATSLRIMIASSNHASYNQSEETATIKTTKYMSESLQSAIGAILTVDNLTFTYE